MNSTLRSEKAWYQAFNDVTKLCLAMTAGCFAVGGLFLLVDGVVELGPRGIALIVVGCFFLIHGLLEVAKQRWQRATHERGGNGSIDQPPEPAVIQRGEPERTAA